MIRLLRQSTAFSLFTKQYGYVSRTPCRCFLPANYTATDLWDARLSHNIFKSVSPRDLGIQLLQIINSGQDVPPIEYDTFANRTHELDITFLDFIEDVMKSFMNTQSAVKLRDSTPHAFIRTYMSFQEEDRLLKLIEERSKTGIFVDFVSAVLLMDSFFKKGQWNCAVAVAWELCLQEYFALEDFKPLVFAASLLSCVKSIENDSYVGVDTPEKAVDDKEIEYKFVPYIRNPNYDNFFDIKRPRLKTGYTLLHLSHALNKRRPVLQASPAWNNLSKCIDSLNLMTRVFGLALSEQCDHLLRELKEIKSPLVVQSLGIDPVVVEKLIKIVDTCKTRPDDSALNRGEPELPTISSVKAVQNELMRIQGESSTLTSSNIFTVIEGFVYNGVINNPDCMQKEIEAIQNLYAKFNEEREKEYAEKMKAETRQKIIKSAKEKLREILNEEERVTYFQNIVKINRGAWLAPRTRRESQWSRLKEWRKEVSSIKEKQEKEESST